MPDISGSAISGIFATFLWVTIRVVDLGFEDFFSFTFGFLSFIFGRSTALGGSNFCSCFFTTVKTTSIPASKKSAACIRILNSTALDIPLVIFCPFLFIHFPLPIIKSAFIDSPIG